MKKFFQALLAVLGLCSSCSKTEIAGPAQFTSEFVGALRQASPESKIEIVRDLQINIKSVAHGEQTAFLDNAYDQYKNNPATKSNIIQRFVASIVETLASSSESETVDRNRIVPVIKDKPWLAEIRRMLTERGAKELVENVYDELNPDLVIVYAEDSPKNIRYLTPKILEKAHIDRKELRALACENLKRILPKIEKHGTNGTYMITAGGDYETSLLLFESLWTDLEKEVHGEVVVAIPARDVLLVTGSENREGLEKMKKVMDQYSNQIAYKISSKLFVLHNGTFVEFSP